MDSTAWSRLRIPVQPHSQDGVSTVIFGSRKMKRGTSLGSRTPVFLFDESSVIPAENENSAAERVVGIAIWAMIGLAKFSDSSLTAIFAESIGLPPPRLIRESALAFCASLIACFMQITGACCLMPENTPTSFRPDAFSTWSTSLVFLAMVCLVIMSVRCDLILLIY